MNIMKFALMISCVLWTGCVLKTDIPVVYLHITDSTPIEYQSFPKSQIRNIFFRHRYNGDSICNVDKGQDILGISKLNNKYVIFYIGYSFAPGSGGYTEIININNCKTLKFDNANFNVSKSGKYVSLCENDKVKILLANENFKSMNIKNIPCRSAIISSNNKWLIIRHKRYIKIYDFNNMELVFKYYAKQSPIIYDDFIRLNNQEFIVFSNDLQKVIINDKAEYKSVSKLNMDNKEIFYSMESSISKTTQYYYGKFSTSTNK